MATGFHGGPRTQVCSAVQLTGMAAAQMRAAPQVMSDSDHAALCSPLLLLPPYCQRGMVY